MKFFNCDITPPFLTKINTDKGDFLPWNEKNTSDISEIYQRYFFWCGRLGGLVAFLRFREGVDGLLWFMCRCGRALKAWPSYSTGL